MNGNYYGDGNQPPQNNQYPPQDNSYQPPIDNGGYMQPNGQFQPPVNNYYQPPLNNGFNQMGQEDPGKGFAIGSLVCGILGVLFSWCFIGLILGIVAIVLAVISGNKSSAAGLTRNGMAVAGLVCGILATIFGAIFTIYMLCVCSVYNYAVSYPYSYSYSYHY